MDNIDNQRVPRFVKSQKKGHKGNRKNKNDPLKVVYISSPMKVKTSASRFRSLVQQLTGKNSDISEYMDGDLNRDFYDVNCDENGELDQKERGDHTMSSLIPYMETCGVSPTSSDSLGAMDGGVFTPQIEEQFAGIFKSSYLSYNRPQMDVLGTYDDLL